MTATVTEVIEVEGNEIPITNPNKILWPQPSLTKIQYLQKLVMLAPYLLPYCQNRYLTMIRFPDGIHGKSFYQKSCPEPKPAFVRTASMGDVEYVNLDSLSTLLWLGNLACLEFHPSFHYIDQELPAEWVIDIDPPMADDPRLHEAVWLVGELLRSLQVQSVPKTSGATGIQIWIPIEQGYTFEQLRYIGRLIAEYLSLQHPNLFTIERIKKNRGNRIYIDYLQHWLGKTLSAPYTPRATPSASVSTPLQWEELKEPVQPKRFNLITIEKRLQTYGDLIQQVPPQKLDHIVDYLK